MKGLIVILLILPSVFTDSDLFNGNDEYLSDEESCVLPENLIYEYRNAHYNYLLNIHRIVAARNNYNFVFSATSIGLMLAAIAEVADNETRQQLFKLLHLPEEPCLRHEYYRISVKTISAGEDVDIRTQSTLAVDESLNINPKWNDFVSNYSLLNVIDLPIKNDPEQSIEAMENMISALLWGLDLTGNSVLLDAVDFNGLWTTAFPEAYVERSPFYNLEGEQTGYVDLMWIKKRVNMTYVPEINAKVLELPIGSNGRYRLLMAAEFNTPDLGSIIDNFSPESMFKVIDSLKETEEPVNVAIPHLRVKSLIDIRKILEEDFGIERLWTDDAATRGISEPAALPSSFVQRTTLTFDTRGVEPSIALEQPDISSMPDDTSFIANGPIVLSILDAETYTAVISAVLSQPTYYY